jgi:hypothetical protein
MSALIIAAVSTVIFIMALLFGFLQALAAGTIFYWLWERLGAEYFYFLPARYLEAPWWDIILLTWLFLVIGNILFKSAHSSESKKSN